LRIVVADAISGPARERLAAAGEVVQLDQPDEADLCAAAAEAEALVVRTYSHVTAGVIEAGRAAGRLKVIGRAGVGLDNIDVKAALAAGIQVVHTPAACTVAVAELAIGLIVAVQRKIASNDTAMRAGGYKDLRAGMPKNTELQHQTLGIIGMGRIGREVGDRLHNGMRMKVIYHDIREIGWLPFPAEVCGSADDVYRRADVVSFHVPLTAKTRGMVDARALSCFRPTAYLINTARGPIVDNTALAEALTAGRLAGAALDVFDPEPPPMDHPIRSAPNLIMSPHVASRTFEGISAMNDVVDDIIRVLEGKAPLYPADPEIVDRD
jgi:D-3-phosphoglycerate dehydrogenase